MAILRRAIPCRAGSYTLRVASCPSPETRGIAASGAMLPLFALFTNRCLQGPPNSLAISAILRGLAGYIFYRLVCDISPALFDEYAAVLESCAAVSLCRAQWGDQHDSLESPVVAGQGAQYSGAADRRFVVPPAGRKCQRFRQFRQRSRAALASRALAGSCHAVHGASGF